MMDPPETSMTIDPADEGDRPDSRVRSLENMNTKLEVELQNMRN